MEADDGAVGQEAEAEAEATEVEVLQAITHEQELENRELAKIRRARNTARPFYEYSARKVSPLQNAIISRNEELVYTLLNEDSEDLHKPSSVDGTYPIHHAVVTGRMPLVKTLIERDADVNVKSNDGVTCLHKAARAGALDLVEYLLMQGADPLARTSSKKKPSDMINTAVFMMQKKEEEPEWHRFVLHNKPGARFAKVLQVLQEAEQCVLQHQSVKEHMQKEHDKLLAMLAAGQIAREVREFTKTLFEVIRSAKDKAAKAQRIIELEDQTKAHRKRRQKKKEEKNTSSTMAAFNLAKREELEELEELDYGEREERPVGTSEEEEYAEEYEEGEAAEAGAQVGARVLVIEGPYGGQVGRVVQVNRDPAPKEDEEAAEAAESNDDRLVHLDSDEKAWITAEWLDWEEAGVHGNEQEGEGEGAWQDGSDY